MTEPKTIKIVSDGNPQGAKLMYGDENLCETLHVRKVTLTQDAMELPTMEVVFYCPESEASGKLLAEIIGLDDSEAGTKAVEALNEFIAQQNSLKLQIAKKCNAVDRRKPQVDGEDRYDGPERRKESTEEVTDGNWVKADRSQTVEEETDG